MHHLKSTGHEGTCDVKRLKPEAAQEGKTLAHRLWHGMDGCDELQIAATIQKAEKFHSRVGYSSATGVQWLIRKQVRLADQARSPRADSVFVGQ